MNLEVQFIRNPGIALQFSDGSTLGDPGNPADASIAASHLELFLERQLGPWPLALAVFETPEDRQRLVKEWYREGIESSFLQERLGAEAARLPLASLLRPYLLTHTFGTSLDASFTTLIPVGPVANERTETLILESARDSQVRSWQLSARAYEHAARELLAWNRARRA